MSNETINRILRKAAGFAETPTTGSRAKTAGVNPMTAFIRRAAGFASPEPQSGQATEPQKPKTPTANAGEGTGTITDPPLTMNERIRRAAGRF